ncbi:MAG: AAA family ATPase, partial [Deinococcales bacterium]
RTLDEFIGQAHIVGPGRLLRRAIQADQLSSLIFYGPPGTGKTTLARVIANSTKAHFTAINAVLAGVKDIREAVAEAQERMRAGRRTILFVDEVHRFNKAQQDALLPWVENGTVLLIGATTENPYFEVNKALVSRSRIFQLTSLTEEELRAVARQALADPDRGYGRRDVQLADDALEHLVNVANGDARAVLNALELAVETTEPDDDGVVTIDRAVAEESIQRRAVLYDKEGDAHFDTISAFIKSVRGSDPDAALYWLAKMVYAGEDPRFILRRLLILASEDVGLADPHALAVVASAAQAYDYVGLPEGRYHLAHATLYLATAPKSNSTMAFFDALASVEREREAEVPNHLKDASRDREGFGHGEGYLYPHAYRDHWVAQQYLPEALQGKVFYDPADVGYEAGIRDDVARRREAQLAAMLESETAAPGPVAPAPIDRTRDRWLQRTISQAGERLAAVRDLLFDATRPERHHIVLDLAAGTGLLTWEALRRTPEGQVWAMADDRVQAEALRQMAERLPELQRPVVIVGAAPALSSVLQAATAEHDAAGVRFDVVLGRSVLAGVPDLAAFFDTLRTWTAPGASVAFAEPHHRRAQRLHALVDWTGAKRLGARVAEAEEALYERAATPRLRWDPEGAVAAARAAGLEEVAAVPHELRTEQRLAARALDAWFGHGSEAAPSYADHLHETLDEAEIAEVEARYRRQLTDRVVPWTSVLVVVRARAARR